MEYVAELPEEASETIDGEFWRYYTQFVLKVGGKNRGGREDDMPVTKDSPENWKLNNDGRDVVVLIFLLCGFGCSSKLSVG